MQNNSNNGGNQGQNLSNGGTYGNGEQYGNPNKPKNPSVNGVQIVAVSKNEDGDIRSFQLQDGTVMDYQQVVQAAQSGATSGLLYQEGNQGQGVLRSAPDSFKDNNLDNLPEFTG